MGIAFYILPILGAFGLGWKYRRVTLTSVVAIIAVSFALAALFLGWRPLHPLLNAAILFVAFSAGVGSEMVYRQIVEKPEPPAS